MTQMDIVAATAGGLAFGWLAIRANMLKPSIRGWCSAPGPVWVSILILSLVCGVFALSILRTGVHATPRETLLILGVMQASLVMLVNLHRQAPHNDPPPAPLAD